MKQQLCNHLSELHEIKESAEYACAECLKTGSDWVHLRTCQTCGITLCCDSSPNRHASKHAMHTDHAVVVSAEPGERWAWCFIDKQIIEY